jgi:hypothetical protein
MEIIENVLIIKQEKMEENNVKKNMLLVEKRPEPSAGPVLIDGVLFGNILEIDSFMQFLTQGRIKAIKCCRPSYCMCTSYQRPSNSTAD